MQRRLRTSIAGLFAFVGLLGIASAQIRVNVMPGFPNAPNTEPSQRRPVRPGVPVMVWGNANGGNGTALGSSYTWTFSANPDVQVVHDGNLSGTVTNDRFVVEEVTFQLLNGSTTEVVAATLVVNGSMGSDLDTVEIAIVGLGDPTSDEPIEKQQIDVNIAIQDGLRCLYMRQNPDGSWSGGTTCAATAFATWAFQNQGHLPANDPEEDIYAEFVQRGLNVVFAQAQTAGTSAPNADVARGAIAAGISDLNGNGRSILLCNSGSRGYEHSILTAAIIASNAPDRVVAIPGPLLGQTYRQVVEDAIDLIGSLQNSSGFGRGGWDYTGPSSRSDMSINSWVFLAMEGAENVVQIPVPDWIKQEAESVLIKHQANATGARPFGYTDTNPVRGFANGQATTGGGLSGLVVVESEGPFVVPGSLIAAQPAPLNSVEARRQAALDFLGGYWGVESGAIAQGNRGNFYAMWTVARALRLTAFARGLTSDEKVLLENSNTEFDWETGEEEGSGLIAAPGSPREGYFSWLLRTQTVTGAPDTRGCWSRNTYTDSTKFGASMETALAVLVLTPKVFFSFGNQAPLCDAGGPYEVECEGVATVIALDGSLSSDPDGDGVTFLWSTDHPNAEFLDKTSPTPTLVAGTGSGQPMHFTVTVQVSDGDLVSQCQAEVTVIDTMAPALFLSSQQTSLWPPNHELVGIGLSASVDDCDQASISPPNLAIEVWSDEPELVPGSGNHAPDSKAANECLSLRAERQGGADGRVYLILGSSTDSAGNRGYGYCTVTVSKDQSKASIASVALQAERALQFLSSNPGTSPEAIGFLRIGSNAPVGPKQGTSSNCDNGAPVIVSFPPLAAPPDEEYQYDVEAVDGNGDALTFALLAAPAGMSIDPRSGLVTWIPSDAQTGLHPVTIEVRDPSGAFDRQSYLAVVSREINIPPVITSQPVRTGVEGVAYRYDVEATDADSSMLTFSLPVAPGGMMIEPSSGLIGWTPSGTQSGPHPVEVMVSDGDGGSAVQAFTVQVVEAINTSPEITSVPITMVAEGATYVYDVEATDADRDTLTFSLTTFPTGMTVNPVSGLVFWQPQASQAGNHAVEVRVVDGRGGADTQSYVLIVDDALNVAPVITSQPPQTATEGVAYSYDAEATDADGDPLTFSLTVSPTGMTIVPASGLVQWTPSGTQSGMHSVTVRVADNRGGASTQAFTITVTEAINNAPTITSLPPLNATEGALYQYDVQAQDPDADALTFTLAASPMGMTIDPMTGLISWVPDGTQAGVHPVQVEVSDNRGGFDMQSYSLTVDDALNAPPTIISTAVTSATEGAQYSYVVQAFDPEGQPLSYSLSTFPSGMMIDSVSGQIHWIPDATQAGFHDVTVRVDDDQGGFDSQEFTIEVAEALNGAPMITSVPLTTASIGSQYHYDVVAIDPEDDPLSYLLVVGPTGMSIEANGSLTWTPAAGQEGSHPVTVRVADTQGGLDQQSFLVSVTVNQSPIITSAPPTVATTGLAYSYDAEAFDPDLDTIAFSLPVAPSGMSIDSATGLVQWTPVGIQTGTHQVQLQVDDGKGGIAQQQFSINVSQGVLDIQPPSVQLTGVTVNAGQTAIVSVQATDDVGVASLTLSAEGVPVPIGAGGTASIPTSQPGILDLLAIATDTSGNVATSANHVSVLGPNDGTPPVALLTSPAEGAELVEATQVLGTADDASLARWELTATPNAGTNVSPLTIASGENPVTGGLLGVLDPTVMGPGEYRLRLEVQDEGGLIAADERIVTSANHAKYGLFSMTFTDAVLPIPSFPVTVQRTYFSGDRNRSGDFGFGWSLSLRSARLDRDNEAGEGWDRQDIGTFLPHWILVPLIPHTVSVMDDDESSIVFEFTPVFDDPIFSPTFATASWTERTSTGATLTPLDSTSLIFQGDQLFDFDFEVYDPPGYLLTLADGRRYRFDLDDGLTQFQDANGNSASITPGGITTSQGHGVTFNRANGLITEIVRPSGERTQFEYDSEGNLVSTTDPEGNKTTYAYDSSHFLLGVVDPLGRVPMRNEYDAEGRLVGLVDGYGNRIDITFDPLQRIETITDRLGNVTVHGYDASGHLISVLERDGAMRQLTWDAAGNKTSETNGLGLTTHWTYDSFGRVLSRVDPLGGTKTFVYDSKGNPTKITDELGRQKTVEYDSKGNPTRQVYPDGSQELFVYDSMGNITSKTNAIGGTELSVYGPTGLELQAINQGGGTTSYSYDMDGNRIQEVDPLGRIHSFQRDGLGNIVAVSDPLGGTTTNEYDPLGKLVRQVDPLGFERSTEYDVFGRVISKTNAVGAQVRMEYDAEGRLVRQIEADGRQTTLEYDPLGRVTRTLTGSNEEQRGYDLAGRLTSVTDSFGNHTQLTYDVADRPTGVFLPDGSSESYSYDAKGNRLAATTPLGTTQFTYDVFDRLMSSIDPAGAVTSNAYDSLSRLTGITLPNGSLWQFSYNANGRLTGAVDPLGNAATFGYDLAGQRTSMVDPLGRTRSYSYDALGFRSADVIQGVTIEQYVRDAMGRVTMLTDGAGGVTSYSYDGEGHRRQVDSPDGETAVLTYTPTGRRETVTDSRGTTRYFYDPQGHLVSVLDANGHSIDYCYDAAGRVVGITTPAGETTYELDVIGRVVAVNDAGGGRYEITRNAAGLPVSLRYPNGYTVSTTYDAVGRPLSRVVQNASGGGVAQFLAIRDEVGNLLQVDESGTALNGSATRSYFYDAASRLVRTTVVRNGTLEDDQVYTLDAFGNRVRVVDDGVQTAFTYSDLDQVLSSGVETFSYDLNGNQVSATGLSRTTAFVYDARKRLVTVDDPTVPAPVHYAYDIDGNLVERALGASSAQFVVDSSGALPQILAEMDPSGAVQASNVFLDGLLLSRTEGGVTTYVFGDLSANARLEADLSGAVTATFEYDPFGEQVSLTGSSSLPYGFGGQRFDRDVGLYWMRARHYDPGLARFLSPDPFSGDVLEPITFNRYLFALANPVNLADYTGLCANSISLSVSLSIQGVLSSIAIPSFAGILSSVKVQLFVAGVLTVATAATIANDPAAVAKLEEAWEALKAKIATITAAATCGLPPLFHYTDPASATLIFATQEMRVTPKYQAPNFTYPPGAYASVIPPVGPLTQRQLSAHFYGGNQNRDVSTFVLLCPNTNRAFIPVFSPTHPDFFYHPGPVGGFVPINTFLFGPNLMLP